MGTRHQPQSCDKPSCCKVNETIAISVERAEPLDPILALSLGRTLVNRRITRHLPPMHDRLHFSGIAP